MDAGTKLNMLRQLEILAESSEYFKPEGQLGQTHHLHKEKPRWFCLSGALRKPFEDDRVLYDFIEPGTPVQEVAKRTGLAVFIGAVHSSELEHFLACPHCRVVVFEPRMKCLVEFLDKVEPVQWAKAGARIFAGDIDTMAKAFTELLGAECFGAGFPVFYIREGLETALPRYVENIVERLEVFYYRYCIYPIEGQQGAKSRPLRNITKGLFYDQQKHLYENISTMAKSPCLADLRGMFKGTDAILAAAGPDLHAKVDYIRKTRGKALLICVSKAAQVLASYGIEADFVVANDTSLAAESSFNGYILKDHTVLVAHSLSYMPTQNFRKVFPFGNVMPDVFGHFEELRLYGSVITTAFSLARFLGCTRHILVGVQLGSLSSNGLTYAGSNGSSRVVPTRIIQVENPLDVSMQTSLNFRDASFWFLDELRRTGAVCINTCRESVLHGPGVAYDEAPEIQSTDVPSLMEQAFAVPEREADLQQVRNYILGQIGFWRQVARGTGQLTVPMYDLLVELVADADGTPQEELERKLSELVNMGRELLHTFDQNGVSYMVDRYDTFSHPAFHAKVLAVQDDVRRNADGMHHYLWYVQRMAKTFLYLLTCAKAQCEGKSISEHGVLL